jgi:hypothetical protein
MSSPSAATETAEATKAALPCILDDMIHMRVWRPVGSAGVEYLTVDNSGELLRAHSTVIGLQRERPFRLTYEITHDVAVGVQEATIELADGDEKSLQSLRLDDLDGGQVFRYEPGSGDTAVELAVDSHGFVGDYPGRFKRILL